MPTPLSVKPAASPWVHHESEAELLADPGHLRRFLQDADQDQREHDQRAAQERRELRGNPTRSPKLARMVLRELQRYCNTSHESRISASILNHERPIVGSKKFGTLLGNAHI